MVNPFRKTRQFFRETVAELKKSTWPNRDELRASTIVVFVALGILGVFVGVADFAVFNVIDLLTSLVKG